jgi:hypothetical protein
VTSDMEQLLREGIDRLTAGATAPSGLVGRARQRNRQRRVTIYVATAAGTALAAALALVITVGVTRGSPRPSPAGPAQTIADVATRTERALAGEAARGRAIEEVRFSGRRETFGLTVLNLSASATTSGSAVVPGVLAGVTAPRMVSWTYRALQVRYGLSATGQLVFSAAVNTVTTRSGHQQTVAYGAAYRARIRWRAIIRGEQGPLPRLTCQTVLAQLFARNLRVILPKALTCGLFYLAGRQRVDGVTAMTLMAKPQPGLAGLELYVDPATYLPVRLEAAFPAGHGAAPLLRYDYRWLAPTKDNLAALHTAIGRARIPASFRRLPANYLPLAGSKGPPG